MLTLSGSDALTRLSELRRAGTSCARRCSAPSASRRGTEHRARGSDAGPSPPPADRDAQLAKARERIEQPGQYLCYEENGELRTVALTREWTRIGRSLAADVRFDDPTVSRRHALIVRQPDGVRVLDDRSLNGVFVNGARVEGKVLQRRR